MYIKCITTALIIAQTFADITRLKRQDQTWIWPKETDEKENTKSTDHYQIFNQITTSKPNAEENPCDRPPPEKPNFKKPGRRVSEAKCMEYLWNTKARVEIEKNAADCLQYLLEQPDKSRRPTFAVGGRDTIPGEFPHMKEIISTVVICYACRWKAYVSTSRSWFPLEMFSRGDHDLDVCYTGAEQRGDSYTGAGAPIWLSVLQAIAPAHCLFLMRCAMSGAIGWRTVSDTWLFKCGSSLLSEKYMLTAAHCSKSPPDTNLISVTPGIVRLGDKNIMDVPRFNAKKFDKEIKRIINHPKYASPKKYYDIALIELEQPVFFTKYMMPACLWTSSSTNNIGKATLTGWGIVDTVHRTTSPELQAAVVDVLESSVCDQLLMSHCNRHWCGMQEHQVCAGKLAGGVDACQGDSGGPLQIKIPLPESTNQSMHYVIGVTSFGIGCAKQNLPGIYTRVSSFVDWIESVAWPDEL